jgi:hypothetical protein
MDSKLFKFKTSIEQREQLLDKGYVLLSDALPSNILKHWQNLAETLESNAVEAHKKSAPLHGACVLEDPAGPRLMRYDDILSIDPDAVFELLGCPAMMAVARELCGVGTVPLQLDILYKQQHPHPVILWHQGAPHPRGYPYLNVGIYLDDAKEYDGCLRYVPGTQHELQDICKLSETYGWEIPGVVEQPAKAGDILVQDMMVLHGSQPKHSLGVRRTIYVEFRPADGILESNVQSKRWIELRKRWMTLVLKRNNYTEWPESWQKQLPSNLEKDEKEISEILAFQEPPIPAVYCNRNIENENYPVPSYLKNK